MAGTSGSAAGCGAPDTERFIRADAALAPVPADSIDAIGNGLDRLQGHVDAGRTIAGDLARLDDLAARLARLDDGSPGAEEQIATLRKALAPSPAASLAAESDDDAPLTADAAQIAAIHPAVPTDSRAAIRADLDAIDARIAAGCAGPDDLPALHALVARLGALGGAPDVDLDEQLFFTRHGLQPFLAPWQMSNAERVVHRAAPPLDLATGDALKARGFTYRGSFLTWPEHPLGANVRQHVLFGTTTPDAAPTEQHWTDDGVQTLIATLPVLATRGGAPTAPAFDACAAARQAMADELHAASPRLVRLLLLALCFSDIPDEDDTDVLRETLTDGLAGCDDAALVWALGTAAEE